MILRTLPEGMAATSALVGEIATRLAAAHAAMAQIATAVVPPAVDPVSVATALGFSTRGVQQQVAGAAGVAALGEASIGVAGCGASYQEGDLASVATYAMEIG